MPGKLLPDQRIAELERRLGLPLPARADALAALTHKSYVNEHRDESPTHNERLEFLGDAVVDLAVSHRLMERFPEAPEGELSKLRARVVSEEALARVARALDLGSLLLLGRGEERTGGREKSSVLADALEAVIAAVYLGAGLDGVLVLVDRHFAAALDGLRDGSNPDYKTRLQEAAQEQLHLSPRYQLVGETGPDHRKVFEAEVWIGERAYARAIGGSKKEAEQAAAAQALRELSAKDA